VGRGQVVGDDVAVRGGLAGVEVRRRQGERRRCRSAGDVADGAATEVENILGYLVQRARAAGFDTPLFDPAALHPRVYERRGGQ
jgi:ketopantoate reductase